MSHSASQALHKKRQSSALTAAVNYQTRNDKAVRLTYQKILLLLQYNSNTSRKLRLQDLPLGIENETPDWAVKPEEPACHALHFLAKQTAIRFGCVTLVVSSC